MLRRTTTLVVLLALVATSCAAAAFATPRGALPITISNVHNQGGEPQVFLESGGAILVADSAGIHRSTNGGLTWTHPPVSFFGGGSCGFSSPVPSVFCDGWVVAQDAAGKLYASTTNGPEVNIATSTNGGATWAFTANLAAGVDGIADRPWLVAGAANKVGIVWNSNGYYTTCAISTDGGVTFLRSVTSSAGVIAGSLAFDASGNFIFAIPGTVYRWNNPCLGSPAPTGLPAHGQGGLQQQSAIDSSGRIYVPQPTTSNAQLQVVGINGWGGSQKTVNVSISGVNSITMPAIAERGGQIAVSLYGTSASGDPGSVPGNAKWDVYLVRITDYWTATPTVTTTKVTTSPVHTGPICLDGINCSGGRELWDYQSVAIDSAGAAHLAWTHDPIGTTYAKVP